MKIHTYNKRRKLKSKEEYMIKKLMNKYKVSKKDIYISIFENTNGIKCKCFICANKLKLINYSPSFKFLKPYFSVKDPFGELEHPSVVRNENTNFK